MERNVLGDMKKRFKKTSKVNEETDILYRIEGVDLILPKTHKLPEYQNSYKNYDKKLKIIIEQIELSIPFKGVIFDIGANVGDTLALIRPCTKSLIYCIEGDKYFLSYLRKNASLFKDVEIIDSYISGDSEFIYGNIERNNGTARINLVGNKKNANNFVPSKKLYQIIQEKNIDVKSIKLIKIDTDGFDFKIILGNKDLINNYKPCLYFEYDIFFNSNDEEYALEVMKLLEKNNYYVIIYDNYGNMLDILENNYYKKFRYYNHYLKSSRKYGGGIYYFDILATTQQKIFENIIGFELKNI